MRNEEVQRRLSWRKAVLSEKKAALKRGLENNPVIGVRSPEHIYGLRLDIAELEAQVRALEVMPKMNEANNLF